MSRTNSKPPVVRLTKKEVKSIEKLMIDVPFNQMTLYTLHKLMTSKGLTLFDSDVLQGIVAATSVINLSDGSPNYENTQKRILIKARDIVDKHYGNHYTNS